MKIKTLEEIEDKVKSIGRKRDLSIIEVDKYQKELEALMDDYYKMNPEYIAVVCPTCNSAGYVIGEDKKKHPCNNPYLPQFSCGGKEYIFMRIYKQPK